MSKKSEHKQAVQTAQRALQAARNAEALARASTPPQPSWSKRLGLGAIASFIVAMISLAGSHWPRVDIDLLDNHFNPDRPFPDTIKLTNSGGSDLSQVSVKMRICGAMTKDLKGTITGRKEQSCAGPTGGRGGIARNTWANHKLQRGESWPLPVAADPQFAFTFNVGQADVSAYVEYWPSILPGFLPVFWTERRFTIGTDRDGKPIWRAIPLD